MGTIIKPTGIPSTGGRSVGATTMGTGSGVHAGRGSLLNSIVTGTLSTLKWVAITLLALFAALLVGVTFVWGPTHWMVSLLLAAAWVGLITLLALAATRYRSGRMTLGAALSFALLAFTTVLVSQASAYTPAIVDAQGKAVPGSIAVLETVNLNGSEQWISIRAESTEKPVLLWLAGGPGGSQLATARYHLGGLEEHFVVVNWEQPGSGKSYHAADHSALTVERYIADGYSLVQQLKARFDEEKIYLVGESWGAALGIWLVQRYPEQF